MTIKKMIKYGMLGIGLSLFYSAIEPGLLYPELKKEEFTIGRYGIEELVSLAKPLEIKGARTSIGLASKDINSLTPIERAGLLERLSKQESNNNPDAIRKVIKKGHSISSVGENQINTSRWGALADYNKEHGKGFTSRDMRNPIKNRIVRNWYLFERIPELLKMGEFKVIQVPFVVSPSGLIIYQEQISPTVANVLAAYNAGIGNLRKAGSDALENLHKLPKETQNYIMKVAEVEAPGTGKRPVQLALRGKITD